MSKQFSLKKGLPVIGLIGALSMSLFYFCSKDNPTAMQTEEPSYSFTGFVIDGYSGKALGGSVVTYFNSKGDSITFTTRTDGGFNIPKIPYGDRSFFFSYQPSGTSAIQYTTAAVTVEGKDWENFTYKGLGAGITSTSDSVIGGIRSVAGPVKLYPLSGALTGNVLSQVHERAELNPVKSSVVKVTFDPAANLSNQGNDDAVFGSNVEIGPSTFEALTDSNGQFSITGIPVSGDVNEKVTVKVISIKLNGIDWQMTGEGLNVELVAGQSVPVGAIIMNPMAKIALKSISNNFKTGVVSPDHVFEITCSDSLDSVSYAVLSYADNLGLTRNVAVDVTVTGKKISIDPEYSLVNEQLYKLKIYLYGKKGQILTDTFNITAAGGGLADVASSNILTDSKAPVYNFGVKTPITITFADSIVGNPSVQVTNNDVIPSLNGKTLTITPRSIWKNGTVNVSVVLKNGTIVRFSTPLNVENALSFVSSNVYDFNANTSKSGLALDADIVLLTNKKVNDAKVILIDNTTGTSLPTQVNISEGGDQIDVDPINALKPAHNYTITVTVENANGESKSMTSTFTTTAANFYAVYDNVRIGNDISMPRLDFAPNSNIIIKMNKKVVSATARLSPAVNVKITIQNDSIIIDPEDILVEGTAYDLYLTAQDSVGATVDGIFVENFVPRALVMIMASNIITADNQQIVNATKDITPWFKLSSTPIASKMKVNITNPAVDATITVIGDTLFVNPASDFQYSATPEIAVTGEATDGNYISFTKSFTVMKKPQMTLVASNVLNSNFEGLTNIAEDIEMWYLVSRTPAPAKVLATVNAENAVVRLSGDTIFVKNTRNFAAGTSPVVRISGLDNEGISFALNGDGTAWPDWPAFTVRQALFPVASNTWDVADLTADNFTIYGTMWVKWSQNLSTDLTKITWSNGAAIQDLYGDVSGPTFTPNASIRISGDTLFVTPIKDRVTLNYNDNVGFQVAVTGDKGQVSNATPFQVNYAKSELYVKATNTVDSTNYRMIDTMGLLDAVWLVSSQPISKVTGINDIQGNMVATNELVERTVQIKGDTIFFTPFEKLARGTQYRISFDVKLSNGLANAGNELIMTWKTKSASDLYVKATNTVVNGQMAENFDLLQTVWIIPSAPIDSIDSVKHYSDGNGSVTPNDNLLGTNLLKNRIRLSTAGDTIFWTPIDTLQLATKYGIEFEVTLKTGEQFTTDELTAVWKTKPLTSVAVKATNTRSSAGAIIDTFGLQQEIYVVSNTPFTSVDEVNSYTTAGYAAIPADMRVLANTRTNGDTIFFTPPYKLGSGTKYAVSFDVTLPNGQKAIGNELYAIWETKSGIKLLSTNDMNAVMTAYREFKCIGDSLVATFSQAIDTSKAFSITGFGPVAKLTYRWSSDLKTVTIKDTSRLATVKTYAITPDYTPSGTPQYENITFSLTSAYGETKVGLSANTDYTGKRPALEIHTEVELVVIDANVLKTHNSSAVVAGDLTIDTLLPTANITITFNRAIDTAAIKAGHRDEFFTLVNSASPTIPLDYAISFSSDAKTVTIDPVDSLGRSSTYNVIIVSLIDNVSHATYSGVGASNYLTDDEFGIQDLPSVQSIAAVSCSLYVDTNLVAGVSGKRIGASPNSGVSVYGVANLNSEDAINFRLKEAAWNANHADSVDGYQWRVRKISRSGVAYDWYEASNLITTNTRVTGFGSDTVNANNTYERRSVNLTTATTILGGSFTNAIRTDLNNSRPDYTNTDHVFNDSSTIELQIRAFKDLNSDAALSTGEFGVWSNGIRFVDNIAPCDSDFVALANCNNANAGGVSVVKTNPTVGTLDRTGIAAGVYTLTLTFPEDMDTSTDASVNVWYETALGVDAAITTSGTFTDAKTYVISLTLAANANYADNAPYYSISVAGMKDASGVTIQSYGDIGTAATGTTEAVADDTEDEGPNNIQGLSSL